ncbi:MAG: chemotaxis response regulator protein-glutamate methylesterase [Rhodospirillales bacterium]|nr:chemotaxis response regulator protein-glutamate methylesterase [Rhodospirillales bacterium]
MPRHATSAKSNAFDGVIRVMVVDDSAVIRGIIRRTLDVDPSISVVASVANGQHAIDSLARHPVDVIVLDIEMPVMDGMTALPKLLQANPDLKIIMASTLTQSNASVSLEALKNGAADYIPKPSSNSEIHNTSSFKRDLVEMVKALGAKRLEKTDSAPTISRESARVMPKVAPLAKVEPNSITLREPSKVKPAILCIGSSTGGPKALLTVVKELNNNFNLPILITQHMPKTFTPILAEHLQQTGGFPAAEGIDGECLRPGQIYVAPGGLHMLVEGSAREPIIRLDDGPQENFCKPSVDPMLRSVAKIYGAKVLTVILTGMGRDGLAGGRDIVAAGGTIVAQDEESSVVWGMPGAVATAGICSAVVPLSEIVAQIHKIAGS